MEMTPELQLQAVLKSLGDNVIPAVDPDNAMAQEQAQLCMAMLQFLLQRAPQAHAFAIVDLEHWIDTAGQLAADLAGSDDELTEHLVNLEGEVQAATTRLEQARAERADLEQAARGLRAQLVNIIEAVDPDNDASRRAAKTILQAAEPQIQRERAWLAPLGIDTDKRLPDLETLLAQARD